MVLYSLSRTSKSIVYVKVISELVKNVVKLVISCNVFFLIFITFGTLFMKAVGDIVENGSESFFFLTIMGKCE